MTKKEDVPYPEAKSSKQPEKILTKPVPNIETPKAPDESLTTPTTPVPDVEVHKPIDEPLTEPPKPVPDIETPKVPEEPLIEPAKTIPDVETQKALDKSLGEPSTPEGALEFMWQTFSNLNDWVRFSDSKAAAVLAADGVILGAFATLLAGGGTATLHGRLKLAWLCLILVSAFFSAMFAIWSLLPQLKVRSKSERIKIETIPSEDSSSLVFFMDIDKHFPTAKEFHGKINNALADPSKAVEQISQQVWANSKIASVKYKRVEISLRWLAIAIFVGFVGVIIIAVVHFAKDNPDKTSEMRQAPATSSSPKSNTLKETKNNISPKILPSSTHIKELKRRSD